MIQLSNSIPGEKTPIKAIQFALIVNTSLILTFNLIEKPTPLEALGKLSKTLQRQECTRNYFIGNRSKAIRYIGSKT